MKFKLLFCLLFTLFLSLFFPETALADTFTLSGQVSDSIGNAVSNASVDVTDSNTSANAGSTTTDGAGNYSLIVIDGTYDIHVTPPAGSTFSPILAFAQNVTADKILNFVLAPQGQLTLSGHIYDEYGNPLPNQSINIAVNGVGHHATTDATGQYSFSNLPTGNYSFFEASRNDPFNPPANNDGTLNEPKAYLVRFGGFSLSQSIIKDYTILGRKVTVHVQDPTGNPINNVSVSGWLSFLYR